MEKEIKQKMVELTSNNGFELGQLLEASDYEGFLQRVERTLWDIAEKARHGGYDKGYKDGKAEYLYINLAPWVEKKQYDEYMASLEPKDKNESHE